MKNRALHPAAGVTVIELIVGIVIALFVLASLLGVFISESRLFGEWESQRTARDAVRSATHVLAADLRRIETTGGIEAANSTSLTLRIPISIGVVCASSAASTTISLLPADSVMMATAALSGQAWRTNTGYTYQATTGIAGAGVGACTAVNITTLTGGRVVQVTPGAGVTVVAGTPIMLYQRVRYEFVPGTDGTVLTRRLLSSGAAAEVLVENFVTSGTSFRFYVGTSATAQTSAPADLSTIRGIDLALEGMGEYAQPGEPLTSSAVAQPVFFRNPPGI
jgi:Tfp pilus assembly protein PilW